jgi:immunity protein Imm5 of predicted polymorphic toxin system
MLSAAQTLALTGAEHDPVHHLKLGLRELIWNEFGRRAAAHDRLNDAHRKRISLAVLGVQKVLPLWKRRYGDNEIPEVALSTIRALVLGEQPDAESIFDESWGKVLHLSVEQPFPEIAVGFAAVQALSTAMYDEFFDAGNLDPDREDGDDPESYDSAYYASIAAAGGIPSDPLSSPDTRLAFWKWWLTDAVQGAHQLSQEHTF